MSKGKHFPLWQFQATETTVTLNTDTMRLWSNSKMQHLSIILTRISKKKKKKTDYQVNPELLHKQIQRELLQGLCCSPKPLFCLLQHSALVSSNLQSFGKGEATVKQCAQCVAQKTFALKNKVHFGKSLKEYNTVTMLYHQSNMTTQTFPNFSSTKLHSSIRATQVSKPGLTRWRAVTMSSLQLNFRQSPAFLFWA